MNNLISETYHRVRRIYTPMRLEYTTESLHTIDKSRRLIIAGHDTNEYAKTSAIALPNSMLLPQGMLAFEIASGVLYNRLSQESYENKWVKWASESTNNLAWLFLFSYHCLMTVGKTQSIMDMITSNGNWGKYDAIKDMAWTRYRTIYDFNGMIDGGALARNTKFHDFAIKHSVLGYCKYNAEEYVVTRIKKRTRLSPMPRVLENPDMFFGTHTNQVFARIITEEIVGEDFDTHYKSRTSARCNAKLIKYYSDKKKENPSVSLLSV